MPRGRKPDAPDLQDAKGNPGKRARRAAQKTVSFGDVRAPAWLRKSPAAARMWRTLSPLLQTINALTPLDAFPLARYCRYVADWVVADEAVRKEGVWYDTLDSNGAATKKRHPAFHARHELDKVLRELEGAFGMRPDERYKMLRDQALVAGLGPLFDGVVAKPDPSAPRSADGDDGLADPIGILGQMDSVPPGQRH